MARAVRAAAEARATASRDLPTPLTVLTYQAVASFDPAGGDGDTARTRRPPPTPRPRPVPAAGSPARNCLPPCTRTGSACSPPSRRPGPATLVLDECHHLLEIWGRLLLAIVGELPDPRIIGLTATPPHMMTSEQEGAARELFGAVDLEVSAPALVRDGRLAPYQELAWFTTPTPPEADYIHGQALRFAELRAGLLDPGSPPAVPGVAAAAGGRAPRGRAAARRSPGNGSPGRSQPSRTPRCGCTATACSRCRRARPSASSTGARRPPRTGWR